MTDNAYAAALVLAAIPTGMASGMVGVWLIRSLIAALVAH